MFNSGALMILCGLQNNRNGISPTRSNSYLLFHNLNGFEFD